MSEEFDFDDEAEMRRWLPRSAGLFLASIITAFHVRRSDAVLAMDMIRVRRPPAT